MADVKNGSFYDKVINEEFFSTPDMGEYWNTIKYKQEANKQSDKEGKTQFFVENPPTEIPGYHDDLGVVVLNADPKLIHNSSMLGEELDYNKYDGDTIKFTIDKVKKTNEKFQVHYTDYVFENVQDYLTKTLKLEKGRDDIRLRFVGIDCPEITHYADYPSTIDGKDIYIGTYSDLINGNSVVSLINEKNNLKTQVNISKVVYRPYNIVGNDRTSITERHQSEKLTFLAVKEDDGVMYREIIADGEKDSITNRITKRCVVAARTDKDMDYHIASLHARDIVKESFEKATECVMLLDTCSSNGRKSNVPPAYLKTFESSKYNPFYSLYDMWKTITGSNVAAYRYAGYRFPGQEANGRFLSAIYLKINNQWINLNKKVLYEVDRAIVPSYTDSVDAMVNGYFLAKGFKMWTYNKNAQLYVDDVSKEVYESKDDRDKIQKEIAGCELKELRDHTLMIGDTLLMIPPTSIRVVSQTRSSKTHLARSKGAINRTLPKTERMIQFDCFFNGDLDINGTPYTQKLPNGADITYYMNGLRGLIAQFKLTPFLPIHNTYLNDVLNIQAVALSNYSITTVPNFPRTLQVSVTLTEFEWLQYMPCQGFPNVDSEDSLFKNGFSDTIHFPLLRYHYQKALLRGEDMIKLHLNDPSNPAYIEKTLGTSTVLQPIEFSDNSFDIYIPDEKMLELRKQAVIEMKIRPLGTKYNFNDNESEWILKTRDIKNFLDKCFKSFEGFKTITDNVDGGFVPKLKSTLNVTNKTYSWEDIEKGKSPMIYYENSNTDEKIDESKTVEKYFIPIHAELIKNFNPKLNELINSYEINITQNRKPGKDTDFIITLRVKLNDRFLESDDSLNKIKNFAAKNIQVDANDIFKDNYITINYKASFSNKDLNQALSYAGDHKLDGANESLSALSYLSSLSDDLDFDAFDINEIIEDLKDSIDIESVDSIKFNKFYIGNPIITGITSSYNNIFANVSLKAVDGHAAQYTGGSDSTLEVEMIADEHSVRQLYFLNRLCVDNLINYRKILRSSPLRINSELSRLLGIYEVLIENMDVQTMPGFPGKFKVVLSLTSVDRTLRNREALSKIKNINNAETDYDAKARTKNYFDISNALGKVEVYPDLELPTCEELEKVGFYFMQNKFQPERTYVDPDFYFLYWYPTFSNLLRTTITEFFENPDNVKYKISDDIFGEKFDLDVIFKDNNGNAIFKIDENDWKSRNKAYDEMINELREMASKLKDEENQRVLSDEDIDEVENITIRKYDKLTKLNSTLNALQEVIDNATYSTSQVNPYTQVGVKDFENSLSHQSEILEDLRTTKTSKIDYLIKKHLEKDFKGKDFSDTLYETLYQPFANDPSLGMNFKPDSIEFDGVDSLLEELLDIFAQEENSSGIKMGKHAGYVSDLIRAGACGLLGSELINNVDDIDKSSARCYPPSSNIVTDAKGKAIEVPICLYPDPLTSQLAQAHNDETMKKGIIFGRFGIRLYTGDALNTLLNTTGCKDGFLDPTLNKDVYRFMYKKDMEISDDELQKRIDKFKKNISGDEYRGANAYFRQMLVWFYILLDKKIFLNSAHMNAIKLVEIKNSKRLDDEKMLKELTESLFDKEEDKYIKTGAIDSVCNGYKNWRYSDEFDKLMGEGMYDKLDDSIDGQEERIKKLLKVLEDQSVEHVKSLIVGIFYSLSLITMSGPDSPIYKIILDGDIEAYKSIINSSSAAFDLSNMSEEQKRMARFVQYADYRFDEKEKNKINPINTLTYNNRVQRAYLQAANDPKSYLLHSFYDMVMHDKRGSMARAFPTYFMLLIDEGRKIGLWKLQDHFYDMHSVVEFEVVKSRKIAADTARIVMTNLYGTFNTEDVDMKDETEYTLKDLWDSIFSPNSYFHKEFVRRQDSREVNSTKMEPGARVHLRMGYTSNAATLPIVFNGCVAEFEAGEMMTLVCQGDGVELSNPHMFNAMDGKDVQDIKHKDKFIGYKGLSESWDNKSTPRDMLVYPLVAEGDFIQELVRKWSSGRFFNSNPFGIVHFGDRRFQTIFPTNGEVEQNIYESLSKPTWDYKESGIVESIDSIEDEYSLDSAPEVVVKLQSGLSYWDLMHIASGLSPDFISAIAPFQMRSTVFHGHPRFYYAYDYKKIDGNIIEKRKPFQQYHVYTSYTDIIDNKITTSQKDIRTNAIGHYGGTGLIFKGSKTVGPLFADIDIFPENQKSTSIDLRYEYASFNAPFNVPFLSAGKDFFEIGDGPNGEKIAWRSTASALKSCMKEMYKGELLVMGDATAKPYDRVCLSDSYEDINGNFEIEQVVHMFNAESGFVTAITPDLISAIDNKYEAAYSSIVASTLMPTVAASYLTYKANMLFHTKNRPLYLGIVRGAKIADNLANEAISNALGIIGKEAIKRDAKIINSSIQSKFIKDALGITDDHIKMTDLLRKIEGYVLGIGKINVVDAKSFLAAVDQLEFIDDIIKGVSDKELIEIKKMLDLPEYQKKFSADQIKEINDLFDNKIPASKKILMNTKMINEVDLKEIKATLNAINTPESKKVLSVITNDKTLDLTSKKGKKFLSNLKDIGDVEYDKLKPIAKIIATKTDDVVDAAKTVKSVSKVGKIIAGLGSKIAGLGGLASFGASLAFEICLTKGAQTFLTNKLRNMQVLTMYPLKKDGMVWTAGIMGHQGSVFGSPAYNEPGWLEKLAISFFDYGKDSGIVSVEGFLGVLRDAFITTPEMEDIINGYRRNMGYGEEGVSPDKNKVESQNHIAGQLANQITNVYPRFKMIYKSERLSLKDIKDKNEEARISYAYYKIKDVRDIEQTRVIADNLHHILSSTKFKRLYEIGVFKLSYDANVTDKNESKVHLVNKSILEASGSRRDVNVKYIDGTEPKSYDIPYLRSEAMAVFEQITHLIAKNIEPQYEESTCDFSNLKKSPIIMHNGTRINGNHGWWSTGYLFSFEVKNCKNISNIIKEIENHRDGLSEGYNTPYTIESAKNLGENCYTVFIHCPKI